MKKILLLALVIGGCGLMDTDSYQKLNPDIYYMPDVKIHMDGVIYDGWGVLPFKNQYELVIESPGEIDLIKISTCARAVVIEPDDPGWFKSGKKLKYTYRPQRNLERTGSCPMLIEVYEYGKKARHAHGFFDFDHGDQDLKADVVCNAEIQTGNVTMCVTNEGIQTMLVFGHQVEVKASRPECELPPPSGSKMMWKFETTARECQYVFKEINGTRFHKHISIGYEEVAVRKQ